MVAVNKTRREASFPSNATQENKHRICRCVVCVTLAFACVALDASLQVQAARCRLKTTAKATRRYIAVMTVIKENVIILSGVVTEGGRGGPLTPLNFGMSENCLLVTCHTIIADNKKVTTDILQAKYNFICHDLISR